MNNIYNLSVLLPINIRKTFTYSYREKLKIGTIVRVAFSNRELIGVVWGYTSETEHPQFDKKKIKQILDVLGADKKIILPRELIEFINWVSEYYIMPLGLVLKASLKRQFIEKKYANQIFYKPNLDSNIRKTIKQKEVENIFEHNKELSKNEIIKISGSSRAVVNLMIKKNMLVPSESKESEFGIIKFQNNPKLTTKQTFAARQLMENIRYEDKKYKPVLLEGVTGSGKTEIYLEAIISELKKGSQVLVLLPEITLTNEFIRFFKSRFQGPITEWHSGLTEKQRSNAWNAVLRGHTKLIIGARSSLFLPFKNLGLIIVDEEHDPSYKQEDGLIYNARDMAVVRSKLSKVSCILVSATPSIESHENVLKQKYLKVSINERYKNAKLPDVSILDMRNIKKRKDSYLPDELLEDIEKTISNNEQVLLFLNRRGYSPMSLCCKCGVRITCPHCDTWLVLHKNKSKYICHQCGYSRVYENKCKACNSLDSIIPCGPGIEKIDEEIAYFFPNINRAIFSSDYLKNPKQMQRVIEDIKSNKINLIIGTQLVSKGHNFPFLTLVGVLDADFGLEVTDIRASEKTHQLLRQVSGRAGRSDLNSKVRILTHMPDHPVLQSILSGDNETFYSNEVSLREQAKMPPFWRLVSIIISSKSQSYAIHYTRKLLQVVKLPNNILLYGPIEAPISKINNKYRYRFLVKGPRNKNIQLHINNWLQSVKPNPNVKIVVDVDPQNFL